MELKGRATDLWGNVLFDSDGLIDHLMRGNELSDDLTAIASKGVVKYNELCQAWDHPQDAVAIYQQPVISVDDCDAMHQNIWFTPEPYDTLDVYEWLLERCSTEQQVERILYEWALFVERDMIPVLRCLIYLVDQFRERGVVWGIGRGSSVASYALFLIGIHRVDSLLYDLDVHEFLK